MTGSPLNTIGQGPLAQAALIGVAVCALWALALATWLAWLLVRRRRMYRAFVAAACERGFDPEEVRALWQLARFAGAADRLSILTSREIFETCVRNARILAESGSLSWSERLSEAWLDRLRRRYGPPRRTLHNIVHTSQIEPNQPVKVHMPDGRTFDSFVVSSTSEVCELTMPSGAGSLRLERRQRLKVSFWRPQDARYEFESEVLGGDAHRGALRLSPAPVHRVQQREHVRVRCRDEVRLAILNGDSFPGGRAIAAMPEPSSTGALRDLSVGGACLVSEVSPEVGQRMLLRVSLNRERGEIVVPAQVVRKNRLVGTSIPLNQISVRFEPLSARNEYQLSRLVAEMQQNLIRRMMVRAGAEEESVSVSRTVRVASAELPQSPMSAGTGLRGPVSGAPALESQPIGGSRR